MSLMDCQRILRDHAIVIVHSFQAEIYRKNHGSVCKTSKKEWLFPHDMGNSLNPAVRGPSPYGPSGAGYSDFFIWPGVTPVIFLNTRIMLPLSRKPTIPDTSTTL